MFASTVNKAYDDQEVLGSMPTGDNSLLNLFWSSPYEPLMTTLPTLYNLRKPRLEISIDMYSNKVHQTFIALVFSFTLWRIKAT